MSKAISKGEKGAEEEEKKGGDAEEEDKFNPNDTESMLKQLETLKTNLPKPNSNNASLSDYLINP